MTVLYVRTAKKTLLNFGITTKEIIMKLLIGADPEVFARKNGKVIPATGLVQGTKEKPFGVLNGAVQVDGLALEFNIDPADSATKFSYNIQLVMNQLEHLSGAKLVAKPVHTFTKRVLSKQPKENLELGCEPDYNAYTGKENPRPDAEGKCFRTAAGHIHIGWTEGVDPTDPGHMEACCLLTKALDTTIGLVSVVMEGPNKRRDLYGKAGAFRPKSYGMEYRVPSNWWIEKDEYRRFIFDTVKAVFEKMLEGERSFEQETLYRSLIDGTGEVNPEYTPKYARYHLWKYLGGDQIELAKTLTKTFGDKGW